MQRRIVLLLLMSFFLTVTARRAVGEEAAKLPTDAPEWQEFLTDLVATSAFGIYYGGAKIGWVVDTWRLGTLETHPVVIYSDESYARFSFLGETTETRWRSETAFSLEDGSMLRAIVEEVADGTRSVTTAVRSDTGMSLTRRSANGTSQRDVSLPKENLRQQFDLWTWLRGKREDSDTLTLYSTEWENDDIDVREEFRFRGRSTVPWRGSPRDVVELAGTSDGMLINVTVSTTGQWLSGMMGPMAIRAEDESTVRDLDHSVPDSLSIGSLLVSESLGDTRLVSKVRLKLENLGDFEVPQSASQRVISKSTDGVVVEIAKHHRHAGSQPLSDAERLDSLRSTLVICSDHPTIVALAKRIAGDATDPVEIGIRLQRWVHGSLEKTYQKNASSAVDVLGNLAGDCTEHAILFVALARAMEIPAREVGGLIYFDEGQPMFGWHAWAEMHDGTQWIGVDPSWGEFYIDATHLKLSEGGDDMQWANLVGKMTIKIER